MGDAAASAHDGEDLISALHDDLLRNVISCLPVTNAARTAALASRWRPLWRSTPLVIHDTEFPEAVRTATFSQVLADHPGPFRAVCCRFPSLDLEHAEWPRLLAVKDTQTLALVGRPTRAHPTFLRLPVDVLRCASLKRAVLGLLTFPDDFPGGADVFPHLQELILIWILMSEQDLEYLLANSPVLKTLVLCSNSKPQHVNIRSQTLKCLILWKSTVDEIVIVDTPLLERLLLEPYYRAGHRVRVSIACAPNLQVLGYLNPRVHKLQIRGIVIEPNTVASPRTVVPSVNMLALMVNFGVFDELKMLASFLRCFPNVDTLHIQSVLHDPSVYDPIGEHHAKFWQEVGPVKCLRSHIKKMVFHEFRGNENEFEFLKFIAMTAQELQFLMVVTHEENFASTDMMNEMINKLRCVRFQTWTSGEIQVSSKVGKTWSFSKAYYQTDDDPFGC